VFDKKESFNKNGDHTSAIVTGHVIKLHVYESVLKEEVQSDNAPLVDLTKLQAVGLAGNNTYWPAGSFQDNVLPMPHPKEWNGRITC
jgi:hypothetical protein